MAECGFSQLGRSIFFWFIFETSIRERFSSRCIDHWCLSHLLKDSKWIFILSCKSATANISLAKNLNVFIVYCHKSYHDRILSEHAQHKLPIYILPVLTNFNTRCIIITLSNTSNCHIYFQTVCGSLFIHGSDIHTDVSEI